MSGITLADAEAHADALVALLTRCPAEPEPGLALLRMSARPYFTWAAAWAALSGRAERQPDDEVARDALAALRRLEPAASALDARLLARSGTAEHVD